MTKTFKYSAYLLSCIVLFSCANKASGPQGGPKDETPPKVMKETPLNGATNYRKKTIEVEFDELITLEKIQENVLISPPQQKQPTVKSYGKKLSVQFEEDLQDSTTYTIDFGNAIVDNNEKNALQGYSFSFATGGSIDSLQIAGIMLNAEDLNPVSSIIAGIYQETDDSVFSKKPFMRIGKTNQNGHFSIKNIREGTYRIYGLGDVSSDYMFQPGEGLALYDSLLTPTCRIEPVQDTVWIDSLTIDSISTRYLPVYYPNNVVLRYFKESKQRQYFLRASRSLQHQFQLYFSAPCNQPPTITPLDTDWSAAILQQCNATNDTITYWLKDSLVIEMDTLRFAMSYLKSDSLYELQPQTDTIQAVFRRPRVNTKSTKKSEPDAPKKIGFLTFKTNINSTFEIYNSIRMEMSVPLAEYDTGKIHLFQKTDTIYKPLPLNIWPLDSVNLTFCISYPWETEKEYELRVDSTAFIDIYGKHNDKFNGKFKIRSLEEYSQLTINLENCDKQAVIQLLDAKDAVVRTLPATPKGTTFKYLKPGDYYMRLFIDSDGNGTWTTGDLSKHRHPEEVLYYPNKLTLRANWDFEESWDCTATPLTEQKPKELQQDKKKK